MKKITEYFRKAVLASSQGTCEFKNSEYKTISYQELESGIINKSKLDFLWKRKNVETVDVIIALKTVTTEFEDSGVTEKFK